MTVTKEMLEHIGVKSISMHGRDSDMDVLCSLVRVKEHVWYLNYTAPEGFSPVPSLRINKDNEIMEGPVKVLEKTSCTLMIEEPSSGCFEPVVKKLATYEKNDNYERRKEKRIKVGIKNSSGFGLTSPQQYVIIGGAELECVIVDASVHGIQLLLENKRILAAADIFTVKVAFTDTCVLLRLNRVFSNVKEIKGKSYVYISAQILEPVHFIWKERVISFLKIMRI